MTSHTRPFPSALKLALPNPSHLAHLNVTRLVFGQHNPPPESPLRTAAMRQKYPNAAELLLSLVIDPIEEDGCTSSDGIKKRLSDLVDNVFEHEQETSPTPAQFTLPTLRVKETIVAQVPEFVEGLYKDYKRRLRRAGEQPPKKKRKMNGGSLDPASFSDEDGRDEWMDYEGKLL